MIIIGLLVLLNFYAIRNYNKFIILNEKSKYSIYPTNVFLKLFLVYVILLIGYDIWDFIDILVLQKKIISFQSAKVFDIIMFIIDRMKILGIIVFIISTIYILTRRSIITENFIITRYGAYNITDLSSVFIEKNNIIRYELKNKTPCANLAIISLKKFKTLDNETQEIFNYLKNKI